MDTKLDTKSLVTIQNELELFPKNKWPTLGLQLGLYQPTLSAIKGDVQTCFEACLTAWLSRTDNACNPTRRALAEALEKMGERALAEKIKEGASEIKGTVSRDVPRNVHVPGDVTEETDMGLEGMVPDPPLVSEEDCPPMAKLSRPKYKEFTDDLVKDVNIIIMIATEVEYRAVMAQTKPSKRHDSICKTLVNNVTIYLGMYGLCEVAILKTGQGARDSRQKLEAIQQALKAQYVISVGICYGLNERKTQLGDVIVSSKVVDISHERDGPEPFYNPYEYEVGAILLDTFQQSQGFDYNVQFGAIVTRPTLLEDHVRSAQIQKQFREALAGEMEAGGIMEVADKRFEAIVIKAITDWGVEPKEAYRKWQTYAAVAAAKYVFFQLEDECAQVRMARK